MARSNAYPSQTVLDSFNFTSKVFEGFGKKDFNSSEVISEYLKKSPETLKSAFSTASQYGLLEMKKKVGYRPSTLFHQIKYFEHETEKKSKEIECFKKPTLYAQLIGKYQNERLPALQALRSIIIRDYGIMEGGADRAVNIFTENLKYLNLLDGEGILRVDGPIPKPTEEEEDDNPSNNGVQGNNNGNDGAKSGGGGKGGNDSNTQEIPIFLDTERTAYLSVPKPLSDADVKQLIEVIQIMVKPLIKKGDH